MAITETIQAKEFTAGAPNITLQGDLRPNQMMASMDENEREFMRLIEEFMERGFNQQEAIDAAREELDKKAMAYGGRAQYGLGSFVKSIGKAVKGVVKGVTGAVKKNPLLAAAALNFAPMLLKGGAPLIGFGKTAGAINLAVGIKFKTLVIVNKLILMKQWEEGILRFCPSANVQRLTAQSKIFLLAV